MGILSFLVPQPHRLPEELVRQCYMQGFDGIPWRSKNSLDGNLLRIQRATTESGQVFIPWHVPGRGFVTLSTTCLREQDSPYHLTVELARGTVGRLRNQVAVWRQAGITIPDDVTERMGDATRALSQAATSSQHASISTQLAEQSIQDALDTIDLLLRSYTQQSLARSGRRNVFLGINLGSHTTSQLPDELRSAINTAVIPFPWREIEATDGNNSIEIYAEQIRWARQRNLRVCGGPILNFGIDQFPDWLYLWEEDPEALQSYMLRYLESVARRFIGSVNLWHAWSGLNCGQAMGLSEEFRLRMGVAALESLRRIDPGTPVLVSFDQPWGEYMARHNMDLAPIHYADTLVRADLGVAGFGLEINLGYRPYGTLPRDLLEFSRLIDRWAAFSLPLVVILTSPSDPSPLPRKYGQQIFPPDCDTLTEVDQARLVGEIIRVCLAKPVVQGIIWNQLRDDDTPLYPAGGLYHTDGTPKPLLQELRSMREEFVS